MNTLFTKITEFLHVRTLFRAQTFYWLTLMLHGLTKACMSACSQMTPGKYRETIRQATTIIIQL
jgi:hypothetical protein